MPGGYGWQFVGKQPVFFTVVVIVLFANGSLSLALAFIGKHLIPQNLPHSHICAEMASSGIQYGVPDWICWYANWDSAITFIVMALGALIMLIYRKNIERVR
jgi:hypothetical protein